MRISKKVSHYNFDRQKISNWVVERNYNNWIYNDDKLHLSNNAKLKIRKSSIKFRNFSPIVKFVQFVLNNYGFCCFQSVAVNSIYKLQFFFTCKLIFAVLLPVLCRHISSFSTCLQWFFFKNEHRLRHQARTYVKLCCRPVSVCLSVSHKSVL